MFKTCALLAAALVLSACTTGAPSAASSPDGASPSSAATGGPLAPTATSAAVAPPTSAPTSASARLCGSTTAHVYHVYRLHLLDACRTVSGVIAGVRSENDGDYHVRLTLDPQFSSMLRPANNSYQRGDLVMEPICQHPATQADAIGPCSGGVAQIPIPPIGTHVSATGAYVLDEQHNGWAELHPLFEIHPG